MPHKLKCKQVRRRRVSGLNGRALIKHMLIVAQCVLNSMEAKPVYSSNVTTLWGFVAKGVPATLWMAHQA